jgi:hypothetical protein
MMYLLTRKKNDIASGTFATLDDDGTRVIQFFVDKDDAVTYNTYLEALDQHLHVSETNDEMVDKMCDALGEAYTVVEPGEIVIPRLETLENMFL